MSNGKPESVTPWQFCQLYASKPPGWQPLQDFSIGGPGWQMNFRSIGLEVPLIRLRGDRTPQRKIDQYPGPCVEILVDTSEADCDKAILVGTPVTDVLAGLAITRLSGDIVHKRIWTGVVGTRKDGSSLWSGVRHSEVGMAHH